MTARGPKVAVFAGGLGTRLSEETSVRPKPMVEVGGKPILWHIMKIYAHHGLTDFVVIGGYKVEVIKDYFLNFRERQSDFTVDLASGELELHGGAVEDWRVSVLDTGRDTMTGGRLKRARHLLGEGTFCLTYGDGVGNVDIQAAIEHHRRQGALATLTAVRQPGRFGVFSLGDESSRISNFLEKPEGGETPWINGGFFVLEPAVFDYIDDDDTVWEKAPLERLAAEGTLAAYRHTGFWQPMDTLRDRNMLEELWSAGKAQWKVWGNTPATPAPDPVLTNIMTSAVTAPAGQRVAAATVRPNV